jgi:3-deoxy-D-manno-octulosonic-acid transferase
MYILYSLLLACVAILSLPWWGVQLLRLQKYRAGFKERMGQVPARLKRDAALGCIWVHAVSVGEVLAVSHLAAELKKAFPRRQLFISTTTLTGQQLARQRFGAENVFYLPLDFGFALRPYIRFLRPDLLVLAETEFWPNLLHMVHRSGACVAIVNARISDRSFPRYRRFKAFFSRVLSNVDLFLPQTAGDAERLIGIGARADAVHVSGNLKFDIRLSAGSGLVQELREAISTETPVIVCGSTTEGEEELVLAAFKLVLKRFPSTVMVLAVRHPERFDKVAVMAQSSGVKMVRRTAWSAKASERLSGCVFLLDTVGELASVYELAQVAFVGGSLVPLGGHNILEPAQHGVAILTGPHTFNFREIVRIFSEGGGLKTVSAENLGQEFIRLLENSAERQRLGHRARELFLENTGATERTVTALQKLMKEKAAGRTQSGGATGQ